MLNQTINLSQVVQTPKQAYLLGIDGHATSFIIDGILKIGRSLENNLVLKSPHVSQNHCQIEKRPHGYYIRDLKSKNGVQVDGLSVMEARLYDGSIIKIADCDFIFRYQNNTQDNIVNDFKSKNLAWAMQLHNLPHLATSSLPVFLQGESGTGKEVLAEAVHKLSSQCQGPFISVNCSALTESLVESELFGHIKGSFTGATTDRRGAFEAARGGTLFLDEIGDLPLSLQPKLLRALENNEIRPVGSDKIIKTNVRIITATHKNLEQMVQRQLFRSDLYFRIHVVKLTIPALKDRMEDFNDLLNLFCKQQKVGFTADAILELKKHSWPGNIRELKNIVSKAAALFPKTYIKPEHVQLLLQDQLLIENYKNKTTTKSTTLPFIKEFEKEIIKARLIANKGNQRKTAHELGLPKSTLHDRIKTYKINIKSLTHLEGFKENSLNTTIVENFVDGKLKS